MKVISEISVGHFKAWSGAKETQARIINEGKTEEFDNYIEEMYPDGLTETQLNDILWFDEENVFEYLGISDEEPEEEEEPEDDEENEEE